MKLIILIFLFAYTGLYGQFDVLKTKNKYVFIVNKDITGKDSLEIYKDVGTVVTNANYVGYKAYEVDTIHVLDSIAQYKSQLSLLPDTGQVIRGEIYVYNDEVCRIVQSHNRSTVNHYDPHDVPALYLFREPGCPEWVQPTGAYDAYNIGDCVNFEGHTYQSKINANVWSPAVYPAGWQLID